MNVEVFDLKWFSFDQSNRHISKSTHLEYESYSMQHENQPDEVDFVLSNVL